MYADYTAPGQAPAIAKFSVLVDGGRPTAREPRNSGVRVSLDAPKEILAGGDVPFRFDLTDEASLQPIADLTPYLGAWAHIIVISGDGKNFIHAHPSESSIQPHDHTMISGPGPSAINTVTGFKNPGMYKLWLQVERRGEVITVPWI